MKPYEIIGGLLASDLSVAPLKVAILIAQAQGMRGGACTMSVATIAERCALTRRAVEKALAELTRRGLLSTESSPGQRARRTVNAPCLTTERSDGGTPEPRDGGGPNGGSGGYRTVVRGTPERSDGSYRECSERSSRDHSEGAPPARQPTASGTGTTALDAARSALVNGYQRRYEAGAKDAWLSAAANHAAIGTVAAWVATKPDEIQARADQVLDGAFADEWMRAHRWPWRAIAKDPSRYAAAGSTAKADSELDRLLAEIDRLEAARNAAVVRNAIARADAIARKQDTIRDRIARLRSAA